MILPLYTGHFLFTPIRIYSLNRMTMMFYFEIKTIYIKQGNIHSGVRNIVFNATFKNISVISWRSVLLVEGTGVPGENHRPSASHWQTLSHNVVSSTLRLSRIRTHNFSGDRHSLTALIAKVQHLLRQPRQLPQ